MNSFPIRAAVCIFSIAVSALSQKPAERLPIGERADLALFGHLKSWQGNGEGSPFSLNSGPPQEVPMRTSELSGMSLVR